MTGNMIRDDNRGNGRRSSGEKEPLTPECEIDRDNYRGEHGGRDSRE